MPGSKRRAETSFTSVAPASSAARATATLVVSIERRAPPSCASRSITGSTRRSSSSSPTGSAPGRVDSPPTSRMSAPSADEAQPVLHGGVGVEEQPAVRERVGRHVHDSHDQRLSARVSRTASSLVTVVSASSITVIARSTSSSLTVSGGAMRRQLAEPAL